MSNVSLTNIDDPAQTSLQVDYAYEIIGLNKEKLSWLWTRLCNLMIASRLLKSTSNSSRDTRRCILFINTFYCRKKVSHDCPFDRLFLYTVMSASMVTTNRSPQEGIDCWLFHRELLWSSILSRIYLLSPMYCN